jgi:large subunit ribosomal protein L22
MEWIAKARFANYSPRKVEQVLNLIRKKSVPEAFKILKFIPKSAVNLITKTLRSAVANSGRLKNNEGLFIKECWTGQGPSMKRYRARAYGRAAMYKRRTCHLTIKITDEQI